MYIQIQIVKEYLSNAYIVQRVACTWFVNVRDESVWVGRWAGVNNYITILGCFLTVNAMELCRHVHITNI